MQHNYIVKELNENENYFIANLLKSYVTQCAQSNFSILIDVHNHKKNNNSIKIKKALLSKNKKPFLFIIGLN